jgi:hypothetical protein
VSQLRRDAREEGVVAFWHGEGEQWLGRRRSIVERSLQPGRHLKRPPLRAVSSSHTSAWPGQQSGECRSPGGLPGRGLHERVIQSMEGFLRSDLFLALLFLGGWVVLMRFVLPRLGVST